ncbi:MAG TPA: SGNH/GDSL hydrolase family protein [Chitinophagales bacterium]|nr:SGNH/GDSL hydrolase family protein [Chitinophagales bacterium]
MKGRFKILLLQIFFGLGLFLILGEFALRLSGRCLTYLEKTQHRYVNPYNQRLDSWYYVYPPNSKAEHNEAEFHTAETTNAMGLVGREIPVVKPDSAKWIFFIGDSFTEGHGADSSHSMPVYFQQLIDSAGMKAEVFNAGIAGSDPFFEYVLLKDKLIQHHPDEVIVSINESDFYDYIIRGGMERFKKDGTVQYRKSPPMEPLFHYSHLFRAFMFAFGSPVMLWKPQFDKQKKEALQQITECLYNMNSLCREHGVKLIVLLHPVPDVFTKTGGKDNISEIENYINRDSITFINTYQQFKPYLNRNNYLQYAWKLNNHFNAKGYKIYAEIIFADLNKQLGDICN